MENKSKTDPITEKTTAFSDEANLFIDTFESADDQKLLRDVASLRRQMFLAKGVNESVQAVQKKWEQLCDSKIKRASSRIVGATIYIVGLGDQLLS